MKNLTLIFTILFCLLFACRAQGQIEKEQPPTSPKNAGQFLIIKDDSLYNLHHSCITLYDLFLYKQECYNDSAEQCYRISFDGHHIMVDCNYAKGHGKSTAIEWVHLQPTFDGFIEWINKRKEK